jgi:DDE superfamily endonuclease
MDVHASLTELPELRAFLSAFQVRFRRPEGTAALERYMTGLLTELPNKNSDTMAQAAPGTSEQRLQEFLTNRQWDEHDLNRQRVQKMTAEAALGNSALVLDDTGFPKQGKTPLAMAHDSLAAGDPKGGCQRHAHRRRGRPRDPFSPSARSAADFVASGPS